MPTPNYKVSIDFLKQWCPKGPWVLTGISLDKKHIETQTLKDEGSVLSHLEKWGKDRNIYFTVNSLRHDVSGVGRKPSREDVKSMDWLHVDIDPRVGEDIKGERERALKLLGNPPGGISKPTVIVFSGGGYQGFWKLTEPVDIDGKEALYEDAKRYNQAIELTFGADNCHNVDRIMRVPGTINRPDAGKRKKGRTEILAELVMFDTDRAYPITDFKPATPVQQTSTGFGTTQRVKVSGNIKRLDDVDDLPEKVSELCKVTIVQGNDPNNASRFPSRSEALFYVCCELVRAEVNNDTIYSILTDPEFKISSSVLDKGTNAEQYALRQIERARENAINPELRKMNERFACVAFSGKQMVVYEDWDEILQRFQLVKMAYGDLVKKFMNKRIEIGVNKDDSPVYMPLGKWWLEHENRRQYDKVTFAPGRETPNCYNMWRGFAYEPRQGDKYETFLTHLKENVCNKDQESYNYLVRWMANAVQHPDCPAETAIVLRGEQGVGKSFVAKRFGRLFGRHFMHVSNAKHITGNFNAHLRDCVILFADEAFYAGNREHASTLKRLITEGSITIESKGVDSEEAGNCLHIIIASNDDWVIPANIKERRFCVLEVSESHIQDSKYFGHISDELRDGGFENLLHFLLNHDLSNFDVRKLPQTQALQDQKVHSFDSLQAWWFVKLQDSKQLAQHSGWEEEVSVLEMSLDFIEYTKQFNLSQRGSAIKVGQFLMRACPVGSLKKTQGRDKIQLGNKIIDRPYYYHFPGIVVLREWWDKKFGGPYNWNLVGDNDEQPEIPF